MDSRLSVWVGLEDRTMRSGFTLVEILIVVIILGILASITVPKFIDAAQDSESAMLESNATMLQKQIDLYCVQHGGKGPHQNEQGNTNPGQFVARMTGKTDPSGKVNPNGSCGPYLDEWPKNPRTTVEAQADKIQFDRLPNMKTGWYYSTQYMMIIPNDEESVKAFMEARGGG